MVILSVLVTREAYRLGLGTLNSPGPGFMIFGAASLLGLLSIHTSIRALLSWHKAEEEVWKGKQWGRTVALFVALLFYIMFLKPLGYLLATFFILLALFRTPREGKAKWLVIVGGAAFTSFITYLIFDRVFALPFPKGLFRSF